MWTKKKDERIKLIKEIIVENFFKNMKNIKP